MQRLSTVPREFAPRITGLGPRVNRISVVGAIALMASLAIGDVSVAHAQKRFRGKQKVDPIEGQIDALMGTDTKAAARAAAALGESEDPRALDSLLDALAMGLHPEVSTAALDAVGKHADVRAYDTVIFYTRYRDDGVRAAALRALGALDDRRVARPVMMALRDRAQPVRVAAIEIVARRDLRAGIEPMLELLEKGEEATVPALAKMAGPDVAKALGDMIGRAPGPLLARTLGGALARTDFGPEAARVQVVRALAKIPGDESLAALRAYVASLPEDSPRQSRREAKAFIKDRTSPRKTPPPGATPPGGSPPGGSP